MPAAQEKSWVAFSSYWWSRVGAWLVRVLHRFIWLQHGLWLYVDDGMLLLPKSVAPLVGGVAVMFLRALGVPLSWRKLDLGTQLVWIGWKFNLEGAHASLPLEKREKLSILLGPLWKKGAKVERREVESLIGLLIWFTAGAFWLRPWLSNFYNLLYKPSAVPRLLSIDQFQELVSSLSQDLRVLRPLKHGTAYSGQFTCVGFGRARSAGPPLATRSGQLRLLQF